MSDFPTQTSGTKLPFIILLAIGIAALGIGGTYTLNKGDATNPIVRFVTEVNPFKTPYDHLVLAIDTTNSARTLHMEYATNLTSSITFSKTGLTQAVGAKIEGYLGGSTDGKIGKGEIRFSSLEDAGPSVTISFIGTENGDAYYKFPSVVKWVHMTKEQLKEFNANSPTDASLYSFDILGSVLSESKALFKGIEKNTIQKVSSEKADGKTYDTYAVEISTPAFIEALGKDPDSTEKDVKDAQIILKDATLKATFSVEKESGYITKIGLEGKRLTQIPTPEGQAAGVSSVLHDMNLTADLTRFNLPADITVPGSKDVMEYDSSIL
ncbi:MAG: hypothetical protein Q7S63_02870 [bacterium]|nr:hypothetical protein [bacterium]